ncbi:hypothetical protein D6_0237 [Aeromonas phage D6]|uniref:Uncharacterized protein n=1 Tax=Aeromonas phage D6 TaxID=2593322 RepID=A0A514TWI4_9CAUD|nr:hypothetical protein PQC08_gp038 [Aeromonas phage D6]QDJ97396.1 hypothetical protein D6_0237 [Aeromonas phage D6]
MSKLFVDNVTTLSNLYEVIAGTLQQIGYEYQAPLSPAEEQEVISRQIKNKVLSED